MGDYLGDIRPCLHVRGLGATTISGDVAASKTTLGLLESNGLPVSLLRCGTGCIQLAAFNARVAVEIKESWEPKMACGRLGPRSEIRVRSGGSEDCSRVSGRGATFFYGNRLLRNSARVIPRNSILSWLLRRMRVMGFWMVLAWTYVEPVLARKNRKRASSGEETAERFWVRSVVFATPLAASEVDELWVLRSGFG